MVKKINLNPDIDSVIEYLDLIADADLVALKIAVDSEFSIRSERISVIE